MKKITNLLECKKALTKIKTIERKINAVRKEFSEDIEELEESLKILRDSVFKATEKFCAERERLSDAIESYVENNWKRDFEGKKSIEVAEGKLFVRSSVSLELVEPDNDWLGVAELIQENGWMDALKVTVSKHVLKKWSADKLLSVNVIRKDINKPGFTIKD